MQEEKVEQEEEKVEEKIEPKEEGARRRRLRTALSLESAEAAGAGVAHRPGSAPRWYEHKAGRHCGNTAR